jgi:ABC-type sulfate transport system substrate-binding protein
MFVSTILLNNSIQIPHKLFRRINGLYHQLFQRHHRRQTLMLKATLAGDVDATTAGRSFPGARAADVAFFIRG